MNKKEMVSALAEKTGVQQKQLSVIIDAYLDVIKEQLTAGNKVAFTGFGTFSAKESSARVFRNPQNGETIQCPAKKVVSFKAGKTLKEGINKK